MSVSSDGCPNDCSFCRDVEMKCVYTGKNKPCKHCGKGLEIKCDCKEKYENSSN